MGSFSEKEVNVTDFNFWHSLPEYVNKLALFRKQYVSFFIIFINDGLEQISVVERSQSPHYYLKKYRKFNLETEPKMQFNVA